METLKIIRKSLLNNKRWIILAVLIFLFVSIAKVVLENEIFVFDSVVYHFLVQHRTVALTNLFKIITNFGGAIILIIITILCIALIKRKKYKITIPINLLVIALTNVILKNIFERPRPDQLRIIDESGFSFPSGHSMASMAFYGYMIYLIYTNVKDKKIRNISCIFLTILVFLIGLSRIYLGVHYTSDVIAGLTFSTIYLIFMISIGAYK